MPRKKFQLDQIQNEQNPISVRDQLAELITEREKHGWMSATPERTLQAGEGLVLEGTERDGHKRRQLVSVSIIDRLHSRGHIDDREFEAGDKLRRDMRKCFLDGAYPSIRFDMPIHADPDPVATMAGFGETESTLDYRRRCRAAIEFVGPELWPVIELAVLVAPAGATLGYVGSVLFGRKENKLAEAAATENLRLGLRKLARFYFGPPPKAEGTYVWLANDVSSRRAGQLTHKKGRDGHGRST